MFGVPSLKALSALTSFTHKRTKDMQIPDNLNDYLEIFKSSLKDSESIVNPEALLNYEITAKGREKKMDEEIFFDLIKLAFKNYKRDSDNGETLFKLLMKASSHGFTNIVNELIKTGVDINKKTNEGFTALMIAAKNGHTGTVEALLQAREINVNMQDSNGKTALIYAASEGHTDTVEALLNARADINIQDNNRKTALMIAASEGYTQLVKALLQERGINLNIKSNTGKTALIYAADHRHLCIVIALLYARGIDINIQDDRGKTALMYAILKRRIEIVKLLLNARGIDVNIQENDGLTALMIATRIWRGRARTELTQMLLYAGADENIRENTGMTVSMMRKRK